MAFSHLITLTNNSFPLEKHKLNTNRLIGLLRLSLLNLVGKSLVDDVGSRSRELNGTGEGVAIAQTPLLRLLQELLVRESLQLHQRLADDRFVLAIATLDVHHHRHRHTSGRPLFRGHVQVADGGHHAIKTFVDKNTRIVAQGVAIVGIEAGRQTAATLIAEEVTQRVEAARILAGLLTLGQLLLHTAHNELLRLDLGHLHVAVGITIQSQLVTQGGGEVVKEVASLGGEVLGDGGLLGVTSRNHVVDLGDECSHLGDELDQSLGEEDHAVVLAQLGAFDDELHHLLGDLLDGLLLGGDLLADEGIVGMGLEGTLHGDVRSRTTHQTYEVVVLLGGEGIHADVADKLRVDLAGSVEAEGDGDVVVLQIAVNGLRAANHVCAVINALEVLGENGSIGVGVISSNHNQTVQLQIVAYLGRSLELDVR